MMPDDFGEAIGFVIMVATFAAAIVVLIREYMIGSRTKLETAKAVAEREAAEKEASS